MTADKVVDLQHKYVLKYNRDPTKVHLTSKELKVLSTELLMKLEFGEKLLGMTIRKRCWGEACVSD